MPVIVLVGRAFGDRCLERSIEVLMFSNANSAIQATNPQVFPVVKRNLRDGTGSRRRKR